MEINENHRQFRVPIKQIKIKLVEYDARIKQLEEAMKKLGVGVLPVEKPVEPPIPVEPPKVKRTYKKEL